MLAKRALATIAIGLGFLSTTSQVIILRELLVAFTGNELTLATVLAVWLLSIAAGCFIFKHLAGTAGPAAATHLFIIAAPMVVFQVILVRSLAPAAGAFGEIVSPIAVLGESALTVAPGAVLLGGLFVAIVAIGQRRFGNRAVALVYGCEAIGSAAAGVVLSLYVFRSADSYVGLAMAGLVALACAGYLAFGGGSGARRATAAVVVLLTAGLIGVIASSKRIDLATRAVQWHPLRVVLTEETRYGNILVTARDGVHDFFENGSLSHTIPDPLYAEETAHIPLLCHPDPRRVLVIGGAGAGTIGEIGKYLSVERIDFVELDPEVIRLTGRFAPAGWLEGRPGISVTPIFGDGRRYVVASGDRYDVVILSVGLPVTLQIARYYTVEFFRAVRRVLEPGGIMAFKIPSGGAYLGPELGALLTSLTNACEEVYGDVTLVPGDYIHVLASPTLPLASLTDSLPDILSERHVKTEFIDRYRLLERLNPIERAYLDSAVASYDTGLLNSDSRPVSATYAVARWAKHFESGRFLAGLIGRITPRACIIGLVVSALIAVPVLVRATRSPWDVMPGALALYAMGLTTMFTQILIIMVFQIVNGYVYGWIAALIAAFMVGMGLASSIGGVHSMACRWYHLAALLGAILILPLGALGALAHFTGASGIPSPLPDMVFIGLALASGALGGTTFAASSAFLTGKGRGALDVGVLAYSLDLCGAMVAGLTTGFLLIPSLGISGSAFAVAVFDGVLLAALVVWAALTSRRAV
jgi:spermidine synthase